MRKNQIKELVRSDTMLILLDEDQRNQRKEGKKKEKRLKGKQKEKSYFKKNDSKITKITLRQKGRGDIY